uniref:BPTI/Kunitz inhibitor domain-containing protein n=1 Tax=Varanus komodoensis TaxID=61221 RepID=A0A8D2IQQ8_VARKO
YQLKFIFGTGFCVEKGMMQVCCVCVFFSSPETPKRCKFGRRNKRCRPFTYGGCGGNANNFPSYHTCARECEPLGKGKELWRFGMSPPPDPWKILHFSLNTVCALMSDLATCEQPRDRGPCTESFPRFYYDAHSKNCSAFDFGSCNGNRNNFMTIEECIRECGWYNSGGKDILG